MELEHLYASSVLNEITKKLADLASFYSFAFFLYSIEKLRLIFDGLSGWKVNSHRSVPNKKDCIIQ